MTKSTNMPLYKSLKGAVATWKIFAKKHMAIIGDIFKTDILGSRTLTSRRTCNIDSILMMTGMIARNMQGYKKFDAFLMKSFWEKRDTIPTHVSIAVAFLNSFCGVFIAVLRL